MNNYHLAQINIAKAKADMESSIMEGFVKRLNEINILADDSKGFVWRLQTDDGDATGIRILDDPKLIVNMSVWRDIESLKNYVYKSAHVELIRDRGTWFNKMIETQIALWWIPAGDIPSVKNGEEKLNYLEDNGPTELAFTFARMFPQPSDQTQLS